MKRWYISSPDANGNPQDVHGQVSWNKRLELPDGSLLVELDFSDAGWDAAESARGMLLPHVSTALADLSPQMQQRLRGLSKRIIPTDSVLQALRKIRDDLGIPAKDARIECDC